MARKYKVTFSQLEVGDVFRTGPNSTSLFLVLDDGIYYLKQTSKTPTFKWNGLPYRKDNKICERSGEGRFDSSEIVHRLQKQHTID